MLLSSHPSAQLSSHTSSPLNGYWLCSQSFHSLSVPITNVSANHRLIFFAYSQPCSDRSKIEEVNSTSITREKYCAPFLFLSTTSFSTFLDFWFFHASPWVAAAVVSLLIYFSLWMPFSQWLPSLKAFSPTLLQCYSLRLSPTLSFILSFFSLPITSYVSRSCPKGSFFPFNSLNLEKGKIYSSLYVTTLCLFLVTSQETRPHVWQSLCYCVTVST